MTSNARRIGFPFGELYAAIAPLAVGFDHDIRRLERMASTSIPSYPRVNIIKLDDVRSRIDLAVAGFTRDEITVSTEGNTVTIKGTKAKAADADTDKQYLVRGIASRDFDLSFTMGEHVELLHAKLADGILTLDFVREVPEDKKPRLVTIS